jgi:hypothetical protein
VQQILGATAVDLLTVDDQPARSPRTKGQPYSLVRLRTSRTYPLLPSSTGLSTQHLRLYKSHWGYRDNRFHRPRTHRSR